MQPLTRQRLAANAFRTLGLSASASQADIDAAARRLRLFSDTSAISATAWDCPALGPIDRNATAIEQAVATLYDPASRTEERLEWYVGVTPPDASAPDGDAPEARHNAVIKALHQRSVLSHDTFRLLEAHAGAPDTLPWLVEVEREGDFEKPASPEEIAAALQELPVAGAAALVQGARAAIERSDGPSTLATVSLLRSSGNVEVRDQLASLLNDLEDTLGARCDAFDKQLRDVLRTNDQNPFSFYPANLQVTRDVAAAWDSAVTPFLQALPDLAAGDDDRIARIRVRCGILLGLLALGWEWSGRYVPAEETYRTAVQLVEGSAHEARLREDLARVAPQAAKARELIEQAEAQRRAAAEALRRIPKPLGQASVAVPSSAAPRATPPPPPKRSDALVVLRVAGGMLAVLLFLAALLAGIVFLARSVRPSASPSPPLVKATTEFKAGSLAAPAPPDPFDTLQDVTPHPADPAEDRLAQTSREP